MKIFSLVLFALFGWIHLLIMVLWAGSNEMTTVLKYNEYGEYLFELAFYIYTTPFLVMLIYVVLKEELKELKQNKIC